MERTIRELIDELEDLAEEHGDQMVVRLAQQPRWAFEYSVGDVAVVTPTRKGAARATIEGAPICYIGEGRQLGYLSGAASVALGWSESSDDDDDDACDACGQHHPCSCDENDQRPGGQS
jgi:hypothetical protein